MPGLYVHIPFCEKKCRYCDFPSFSGKKGSIPAYMAALEREMKTRQAEAAWGELDTVFIGGGTPSLLPPGEVAGLMDAIKYHFAIAPDAEISIECNPGTVDGDRLREYKSAGINRLSIGLQSADDRLLGIIGRIHTRAMFEGAFFAARQAGFSNINVDVMHGLPGQSQGDYIDTLRYVAAQSPEHVSGYSLILEEGTPLMADVEAGAVTLPTPDAVADMQDAGTGFLAQAGYARYEISNFAKAGFACRHNINYWENGPYLGLGVGAHSAWQWQGQWSRFCNPAGFEVYMNGAGGPIAPQIIPPAEERFETVMLGFRMLDGISLSRFESRFGVAFSDAYPEAVRVLTKRGLLELDFDDDRARLTPRGLDIENTVLMEFCT